MSAIGLRVGPFEICEEAAVPGPDSWYRAERTGLSRRQPSHVLVRLLGPSPTSRELSLAQRHFDVLRSLDDRRFPKAVALYEGSGALAVEAIPGLPMSHIVEARLLGDVPMTPATVLDLALEMTEAMAHAHGKGAHHGHMCAESVTLGTDGRVLVWGMGEFDARPPFAWLAPELARGEQTSDQTDQWSLGALIVALVTGRSPWNATSASSEPASGQIEEFVGPVARQWPALGRLCRRMLDANPQLRFPSLHPVRLELLGLARRAGGSSDRRALGAWLHRRDAEGRATPEMVSDAPMPTPTPQLAPATVEPPAVQVSASPSPTAVPMESTETLNPTAHPEVVMPQIDKATRGGIAPRPRVVGPHASEAMAVVAPVGFEAEPDPSALPTEMYTEQATEMQESEAPEPIRVPPVRAYQVTAAPTVPSMDVPEPSAPKPAVAVELEFEFEEADDLMVEDPMIEITSPQIMVEAPSTPVQAEWIEEVEIELDEMDLQALPDAPEPLTGVVPFTNPDFGGPSLGLDMPTPGPAPKVAHVAAPKPKVLTGVVQPAATSGFPDLGLEPVDTPKATGWPWESHSPEEPASPSEDPIVRVAPWLASGVVAALALLLVVNVLV